jgi:hypothetical protein
LLDVVNVIGTKEVLARVWVGMQTHYQEWKAAPANWWVSLTFIPV